ncbi:MAG: hypothetical protein D6731_23535 [Planctomycetota bacterium]|nr:MAG: hypothetical protein D6731_23535 [Planctomycetota bacterium]
MESRRNPGGTRRNRPPPLPRRGGEGGPRRPAPAGPSGAPASAGGSAATGRVVRHIPNAKELNDKIRKLLATHITDGVKQATEAAKKAVEGELGSERLVRRLEEMLQRALDDRLPQLSERLGARVLSDLGPRLAEIGEEVRKAVTEQALDAMKLNAPRMGEAAFPRVLELMQDWLAEDPARRERVREAVAPRGEGPATDAELLASLDERLRALEAAQRQGASEDDFARSLGDRVAALEDGRQAGAEEALAELEERVRRLEDTGLPGPSAAVSASLATDAPPPDLDVESLAERVASLESSRGEFADQVAEEVASMGDRAHALEKTIDGLRGELNGLVARLDELGQRLSEVAARPSAPQRSGGEVPEGLDLKDIAERVAVLAVGPLMQAIDGRLEELDLEGLPARLREELVPGLVDAVLERLRNNEGDASPAPMALPADEGYVDEDFARFRRERLEQQGRRASQDSEELGYLTESDAGRLDPHAPEAGGDGTADDEGLDPYAARQKALREHAAQWARSDEEGPAEATGDEPADDAVPPLPDRTPTESGEEP